LFFKFQVILFYLELFLEEGKAAKRLRLGMARVFSGCVSCGKKLAGRRYYCGQFGEDSQSTADALSQVPVLTTVMIQVPGPAKKHSKGKGRRSNDCTSAARDTSKSKGSAAGGISAAQASGQVLESLPAAVASRASPQAAAVIQAAAQDNASVHKGEELTEKLEQHGIILRFLPPNMTAWLQPLDLLRQRRS
jgi:hypothetical protein